MAIHRVLFPSSASMIEIDDTTDVMTLVATPNAIAGSSAARVFQLDGTSLIWGQTSFPLSLISIGDDFSYSVSQFPGVDSANSLNPVVNNKNWAMSVESGAPTVNKYYDLRSGTPVEMTGGPSTGFFELFGDVIGAPSGYNGTFVFTGSYFDTDGTMKSINWINSGANALSNSFSEANGYFFIRSGSTATNRTAKIFQRTPGTGNISTTRQLSGVGTTSDALKTVALNSTEVMVLYPNAGNVSAFSIVNPATGAVSGTGTLANLGWQNGTLYIPVADGAYLLARGTIGYSFFMRLYKRESNGSYTLVGSPLPLNQTTSVATWVMPPVTAGVQLYNGANLGILSGAVNKDDLKLLLLDGTATFTPANTTIDQVTDSGAKEVFGSNWPQGGVALSNTRFAEIASKLIFTADPLQQSIIGTLTAEDAVIYEVTSGKPIAFLQFDEMTAEVGEVFKFDWDATKGIFAYY